ncbi:hypothetical protein DM02DRAFT_334870 [Periconia macrospinosa]|uniref:Uncharacterized protein n=1 Tax=Periconia macrospinosa TaxID=97972 RepID=A0A2V1D0S6_9PLEO|nr:hypothetical protein DM02DRAFT_334870 [Periconia macrospinosa]
MRTSVEPCAQASSYLSALCSLTTSTLTLTLTLTLSRYCHDCSPGASHFPLRIEPPQRASRRCWPRNCPSPARLAVFQLLFRPFIHSPPPTSIPASRGLTTRSSVLLHATHDTDCAFCHPCKYFGRPTCRFAYSCASPPRKEPSPTHIPTQYPCAPPATSAIL